MICTINEDNIIINIVDSEIKNSNQCIYYPWNSIGEKYTDEMPLDYAKSARISELKRARDTLETTPIIYQGYTFDYDSKARERINAAIVVLEDAGAGASLTWTTADDKDVKVTASDLRGVIAAVAMRSDKLHTDYREAKAKVEAATSEEELDKIILEVGRWKMI